MDGVGTKGCRVVMAEGMAEGIEQKMRSSRRKDIRAQQTPYSSG